MAVGLNSAIRFKSALRGIYFVPNILGGLVIGYIFSFIFTPTISTPIHAYFSLARILFCKNPIWNTFPTVGLNSAIRFKSALRGIYFVPNILGGLVIGYIFSFIFTYILPTVGNVFHIGFLQNSILASEKYAWIGVLIVGVWQAVAMNTIIYISGLQTVPEEVYEASMLDGASKWKQFWKVTFPLVMPFVTINLVLSTKNFLMVFDQIMSLTKGGPAQSTESISYLIYKNGMDGGQFGFQSANAVLFFVVIVAISIFQMTVKGKKEEQL